MTNWIRNLRPSFLTVVFPAVVLVILGGMCTLLVFSGKSYAMNFVDNHPAIIETRDFMKESKADRVKLNLSVHDIQLSLASLTELARSNGEALGIAANMQIENARQITALSEQIRALSSQESADRVSAKDREDRIEAGSVDRDNRLQDRLDKVSTKR